MYLKIILLALMCLPEFIYSQDPKAFKNDFLEAEYFFLNEHYDESAFLYQQLLKTDSSNYNLHFLLGASYLSTQNLKLRSIPHLELASKHISPSYREGSWKERNAPREVLFALAKAYHVDNRFDESIELYQKYMNVMGIRDPKEAEYVQKHIRSAELAKEIVGDTANVDYKNIGELFTYEGYRAVIAELDSTMVFMTQKPFYTALMMSKWVNGSWTEPEVINDELKIDGNYTLCSISYDGKELYVSMERDFNYDIYVSYFEDGRWKPVQRLGNEINSEYNETHASITRDKRRIYFTSDRPEGMGATDIYYADRNENADWGQAINLGEKINTRFSEETPFPTADGKTLYFSSKGHETMGGFDIFFTRLQPDDQWSTPVNYGYPLNTADDDLFLVPLEGNMQALYTPSNGLLPQNTILAITILPREFPVPENEAVDDFIIAELRKIESEQLDISEDILAENIPEELPKSEEEFKEEVVGQVTVNIESQENYSEENTQIPPVEAQFPEENIIEPELLAENVPAPEKIDNDPIQPEEVLSEEQADEPIETPILDETIAENASSHQEFNEIPDKELLADVLDREESIGENVVFLEEGKLNDPVDEVLPVTINKVIENTVEETIIDPQKEEPIDSGINQETLAEYDPLLEEPETIDPVAEVTTDPGSEEGQVEETTVIAEVLAEEFVEEEKPSSSEPEVALVEDQVQELFLEDQITEPEESNDNTALIAENIDIQLDTVAQDISPEESPTEEIILIAEDGANESVEEEILSATEPEVDILEEMVPESTHEVSIKQALETANNIVLVSEEPALEPEKEEPSMAEENFQLILAEADSEVISGVSPDPNYPVVAEAAYEEQAATEKFLLTGTILFGFDSYRLDEIAMNTLDQLYALMKLKPELNVEITGYTDSKGKASYNLWLSKKRSDEVINYLVKKGIAHSSLASSGAGATNFIARNINSDGTDNPEGRKYNRRAEISLLNNVDESIIVEALQVPEHLRFEIAHTMNRDLAGAGNSSAGESSEIPQKATRAYTIQLLAMRNPVREDFFDPSEKVTRIQGEDGLYRYISGTYNSISEAKAEIGNFKKMGFIDAFIRVVPLEI